MSILIRIASKITNQKEIINANFTPTARFLELYFINWFISYNTIQKGVGSQKKLIINKYR